MTAETNMLVFTLGGLILLRSICISFYSRLQLPNGLRYHCCDAT
jgi:hypothetical protein